jgi:hypothetical protein
VTKLRERLSFANVVSVLALFVALGGGAYAATQLPKDSVGAKQLKKNAVTSAKLKNEAVTTAKLRDKAVNGAKVADSAVGNPKIADGAVTNSKIADGAVTNSKIADGAVTGSKIAADSVTTTNISGGALIPRGYAWVDADGKVSPGFTINIPDAEQASGNYCFTLGFQPKIAEVTLQGDGEPNDIGSAIIPATGEPLIECPASTNLQVQVWDTVSESLNAEPFFLVVW